VVSALTESALTACIAGSRAAGPGTAPAVDAGSAPDRWPGSSALGAATDRIVTQSPTRLQPGSVGRRVMDALVTQ
jgi:hypothetical protein